MATAKQIAWRKRFAKMAKAGAFKRQRTAVKRRKIASSHNPTRSLGYGQRVSYSSGKKRKAVKPRVTVEGGYHYHLTRKEAAAALRDVRKERRKKNSKPPSPAQLRARRKFAAMAKARAKAARAAKRNPAQWKKYATTFKVGKRPRRTWTRFGPSARQHKKGVTEALQREYGGRTKVLKIKRVNPRGHHLPGLPAKYQRMYEHILATSGSKRIAAATVHKAVRRHNPGLFARLFGKKTAAVGARKTQRGRRRVAAVGYRRVQRGRAATNPTLRTRVARRIKFARAVTRKRPGPGSAKYRFGATDWDFGAKLQKRRRKARQRLRGIQSNPRGFNVFRGRPVKHVIKSFAANGTPRDVKECGGLVDMHLRGGKKVRFNPSRARLCYKGNRLHIVGARFRKPNPPGEEDYGEILKVAYVADKPHLESDDRSRTYEHRFGEEGGVRPHLVVDAEGLPIISGGTYTIPTEGIRD